MASPTHVSASKLRRSRAVATKQRLYAAAQGLSGITAICDKIDKVVEVVSNLQVLMYGSVLQVPCTPQRSVVPATLSQEWEPWQYFDAATFKPQDVEDILDEPRVRQVCAASPCRLERTLFLEYRHSMLTCPVPSEIADLRAKESSKLASRKPGSGEGVAGPKTVQKLLDPWVFLDKLELGSIRAACADNLALVDEFTPFVVFVGCSHEADADDPLLEQSGDTVSPEPDGFESSCLGARGTESRSVLGLPREAGPAITSHSNASSDSEGVGTTEGLDVLELEELCQMAMRDAPEDSENRFKKLLRMKRKGLI